MIEWRCKSFNELTTEELYKILQIRNEVFVVEQNCAYQDCDNKDFQSYHLVALKDDNVIAYSRLLPPGIAYPDAASVGRVVTSSLVRKQNLGKELFAKSLDEIQKLFGNITIIISAQVYLKKFYENFSFVPQGEVYIEDHIPHIKMVKKN